MTVKTFYSNKLLSTALVSEFGGFIFPTVLFNQWKKQAINSGLFLQDVGWMCQARTWRLAESCHLRLLGNLIVKFDPSLLILNVQIRNLIILNCGNLTWFSLILCKYWHQLRTKIKTMKSAVWSFSFFFFLWIVFFRFSLSVLNVLTKISASYIYWVACSNPVFNKVNLCDKPLWLKAQFGLKLALATIQAKIFWTRHHGIFAVCYL